MKLGDVVQISMGVPELAESVAFYEALGFSQIAANLEPWPWAQFSDGRNLILLNQDGNEYLGLTYFSTNVAEKVAQIEALGVSFLQKQRQNGRLHTAIFGDPNGLLVGLIQHEAAEMPHPTSFPLCHCGKFGELAVAVHDFGETAVFWQQFGFEPNHTSNEPNLWGIFSDGQIMLGFHETTEFADNSPALTYFAPDMPQRIEQIRQAGILFASEMADEAGKVRNATLEGPAGEAIFMFEGQV
jgi:predicted lactoylglutathione lyase